ncbi:ATP-binding protein [Pseudonocardia parietis]|uniref:DNA-binding CsgD family transcriptional regulator n=1 Tax=Pseudonocardia parietis TaxID=570936 RepID=A0ABS4VU17_9PSEU|nr:AAA family ATPase [Pseudonocardia parietis]MBP2367432.1 DNA-binding CsgD family transcriptional regulator [Pseudonocardia parietis]
MPTPRKDRPMLMGRHVEHEVVERLLARTQAGDSGVLVVRGEAGIGKTAVLQHVRASAVAAGFRVEDAAGVEAEAAFAFAGLHQLCAPLLARATELPEPQQAALGVAFGMREGAAPDRFLVGLAVLSLLAEVAEDGPLLCVVDDAQWLDQASAQVLAFVARRVAAERVVMVFALRDSGATDVEAFTGLPELHLEGLAESDARTLLATAVRTPLDDMARDRIVAEARGNPLALLELPRGAPTVRPAGGFELPEVVSVPRRVEDGFRRRAGSLPPDTQLLLVVAAAEPTGDAALLWRAAGELEIARKAAAPAEAAGLLEFGTRVRFRHPLVRSAVYRAATPPDQRRAHGALAGVTDPQVDPDRRAWHRAQSVVGTDEEAAAELERSAGRARARGGVAAAAAFLQRAAELTPEPAVRAGRALEAAHAKHGAGASEAALELLTVAATGPLDDLQQARLELLGAQIAFHLARGGEGPRMLLDAARSLAPLDPALSRDTYLEALDAALVTGGLGPGGGVRAVAEAARAAPAPPESPRPADLLLDGLVTTFMQGYAAGVPGLRRALDAFARHERDARAENDSDDRRWLWLAGRTAMAVFDDEMVHALAARHVRLAREAGALATLPAALLVQSVMLVLSGEFSRAAEQTAIAAATRTAPLLHGQLILAAWRGRPEESTEIHATMVREAAGRGRGTEDSLAQYAMAVLHNGLGDYPAAQAAATRAFESAELTHSNLAHSELIEAACRTGQPERAADALDQLCSRALASGTPWGLGLAARSRALASTGPAAEEHYREAIERLRECRMATQLARAHLVYGEWLRRQGRRQAARQQLRTAHQLLSDMGAEAFAARAARELRATGERPRSRSAQPSDALTAQELTIARLVATGATSREVGAQLFLSPRTIEAHLRSIFRKLDIGSRRQLRDLQLP